MTDTTIEAYEAALYLAQTLHEQHYSNVPQWKPLDDTVGVITQIDNMVAGIVAERDTLNARVAELEAALMEVLAFHAQVAHGSVNLTSLSLTMNRAETALQEKTDDQ